MAVVRVILVDDHELFLAAARVAVEARAGDDHEIRFEVVGGATDGRQVLPLVERLRPDLVLLDLGLPGIDGIAVLELLRARHPQVIVVILSARDTPESVQAALARGAAAYILKTIHPADLASILRQIIERSVYRPAPTCERSTVTNERGLTERELEMLQAVARGLSNAAVAEELFLTVQTVKFHLTNVFRKLGVKNRTAAVREAHRLGLAKSPYLDRV